MQRADCRVITMWVCTDLYKLFVELLDTHEPAPVPLRNAACTPAPSFTLCLLDKEPAESLLTGSRTQDKDTGKF